MRNTFLVSLLGLAFCMMQAIDAGEVRVNSFELSGCAAVSGGVIVADDELVGSILFISSNELPYTAEKTNAVIVKLQRKRKYSKPKTKEDRLMAVQDVEGLASDCLSTVFLIGSHHKKSKDYRKTDREFLIRGKLDLEEREIESLDVARDLLERINEPLRRANIDLRLTETDVRKDMNIEGLAYHDGRLAIGFRAPLSSEKKAILVVVNEGALFATGDLDLGAEIHFVDLEGRGIRGLASEGNGAILILSSNEPSPPSVFRYNLDSREIGEVFTFEGVLPGAPEGIARLDDQRCAITFDNDEEGPGSIRTIGLKRSN